MLRDTKLLLVGQLLSAEDIISHVCNLSWDEETARKLRESLTLIRLSTMEMERSTTDEA